MTEYSQNSQENFYCEKCNYYANRKTDLVKHFKSKKHLNDKQMKEHSQNSQEKFYCEKCNYYANRKTDLVKHFKSKKHLNDTKPIQYICEFCNKIYKFRQGLHTHKHKCAKKNIKEKKDNYKDLILQVLHQNKELQELFITQQEEHKKEIKNLILHIKPNHTITNCNNKTINNNNHVNIMMFLNDKCKDAMTIQDFANNLVVNIEDLEKKKFDCLTNTILKNLKSLSITERPVHCGNIKKKEWYLNDKENGWELDNGEKLIKKTEFGINNKYQREFKKHYPNYSTQETIQDKYMNLIHKTLTDLPENEKSRLLNILAKDLTLE
jgi:hypothetical protein